MGHRLSKIYTRTGDKGTTGLGNGSRVEKDHPRVEAFGTVDELNSHIGAVLANKLPDNVRQTLVGVQHDLFDLGGEVCVPGHQAVVASYTERLEQELDSFNDNLPPLKEFILPAGGYATSQCHIARTVCRRAERRLYTLSKTDQVSEQSLAYINRLSDLLFVLARVIARFENGQEVLWQPNRFDK
ncbi:MAG: cob(I)yrinic acid a,c-diamide adenosyltransferase [Thioalkalispiraceae bacterium]|jgi:cob(I)alamin adenosyltransferase